MEIPEKVTKAVLNSMKNKGGDMPNRDRTGRLGRGKNCNDRAKADRAGQGKGYGQKGRGRSSRSRNSRSNRKRTPYDELYANNGLGRREQRG